MSARRPGLVRAGFRRLNEAPQSLTVVADPLGTRKSGEWYAWGYDFAPGTTTEVAGGTGIAPNPGIPAGGGGVAGYMCALPCWFPEPGTITAIGSILISDQGGSRGWVGISRDAIVGSDHYPALTSEASALIVGGGTGARKIRGGAVSMTTLGNEILWWLFQDFGGFGVGSAWTALDRRNYAICLGITSMSGLAVDGTIPGATFSLESGIGYQTTTAVTQTLGRGFPRTGVGLLSAANNGTMFGNSGLPAPVYQWTRAT